MVFALLKTLDKHNQVNKSYVTAKEYS
jgi:hypothetical protein